MKNTCKLFVVVLIVCLLSGVSAFATEETTNDSVEMLDDLVVDSMIEIIVSDDNRFLEPSAFFISGVQADEEVSMLSDDYEIINGYRYRKGYYVKTRGQINAPALKAEEVLPDDMISGIYSHMQTYFPNVFILGEPTTSYNCHSYAWYNSTTYNNYWIASIESFVNDVHTVSVEPEDKTEGNIAVYINANGVPQHSAIVIDINGDQVICESKWGAGVLCQHEIGDVPAEYMATNTQCWILYFDLTPHDYEFSVNGNAIHTKTCTICPYSETEGCNLTYSYIGDSMHNAYCEDCGYGLNGLYCSYEYQSNSDGTHTKTCTACNASEVLSCDLHTEYSGSGAHVTTCTYCDRLDFASCTGVLTHYEDEALGDAHKAVCRDCGNDMGGTGEACTIEYVFIGTIDDVNHHARFCTECGYRKTANLFCVYVNSDYCRFCGVHKDRLQAVALHL